MDFFNLSSSKKYEGFKAIKIPREELQRRSFFAQNDIIIHRIVQNYITTISKSGIELQYAKLLDNNEEEIIPLETFTKQLHEEWMGTLQLCIKDLLTYGFYILEFSHVEKEDVATRYMRHGIMLTRHKDQLIGNFTESDLDSTVEKFSKPKDNKINPSKNGVNANKKEVTDSNFTPNMSTILPKRIDPTDVDITWYKNDGTGEQFFEVRRTFYRTGKFETIPAYVFVNPDSFNGDNISSPVSRAMPYARNLDAIMKSHTNAAILNSQPNIVVGSQNKAAGPKPIIDNESTGILFSENQRYFEQLQSMNAAAASTSLALTELTLSTGVRLTEAQKRDQAWSNLVTETLESNAPWKPGRGVMLPPNHFVQELKPPEVPDLKTMIDFYRSAVTMEFGLYPSFLSGDIAYTNMEGLRVLNKQVATFVERHQKILECHIQGIFECCFPDVRRELSGYDLHIYNRSRIKVHFKLQEQCTIVDLITLFDRGAISNETFTESMKTLTGVIETDTSFKPRPVSKNETAVLKIKQQELEMKNYENVSDTTVHGKQSIEDIPTEDKDIINSYSSRVKKRRVAMDSEEKQTKKDNVEDSE